VKILEEDKLRTKIKEFESDLRLNYKPAHFQSNPFLAAVQIGLKSKLDMLYWVLGEDRPQYGCDAEVST
jgi:hypothetical protein